MIHKKNVLRSRSSGFVDPFINFTNRDEESLLRVMPSARREAPTALISVKTRYIEKRKNRSPESIVESLMAKRRNKTDQSQFVLTLPVIKAGGASDTINTTLKRHILGTKSISARDKSKLDGSDEYMQVDLLTTDTTIQTKPKKKKIPIEKDTTATIVAFNPRNVIIHPKFMQKRGSMCICELWHGKDKQKVANKYPEKIIDGNRVPRAEMSKDNTGIFRPDKLEMEIKTLRRIHDNKLNMDVEKNPIHASLRQVEPTMLSMKKLFPESRKKSPSDSQQTSKIAKNSQELLVPSISMQDAVVKTNTIISVIDERKFIAPSPDLASSRSKEASPDIRTHRRPSIENEEGSVSKEYCLSPDMRGFPHPEVSEIVMKLETNAIDSMVLPDAEKISPQGSTSRIDSQMRLEPEPYFNQKEKDYVPIKGLLNLHKASGDNESPNEAEEIDQDLTKTVVQVNMSKQNIIVTTKQRQTRSRRSIGQDKSNIISLE